MTGTRADDGRGRGRYVALTACGTDTALMAADHALRHELNRRIRDDLITLGAVYDGPAVTHRRRHPGQSG